MGKPKSMTPKSKKVSLDTVKTDLAKAIFQLEQLNKKLTEVRAQSERLVEAIVATQGKQEALGSLFLGSEIRSNENPEGITLQEAFDSNKDGLKTAYEKIINA